MRILLDECVPRLLRREFPDHEVRTVVEMGWAGKRNGESLRLLAAEHFAVFLTTAQNLRYQQKLHDAAKRYLQNDAHIESQHRKKLRPNPLAPWELRIGQYRVFYEVEDVTAVKIVAIGYKEHNDLFIRGQRVEL